MLKDPADIERFVRGSEVGDRAVYGRGESPPREISEYLRPYIANGALETNIKRDSAGAQYQLKRGRGAMPTRDAVNAAKKNWRARRKGDLGRVFECLVRAACRNEVCPTNQQIGHRCGLSLRTAKLRVEQLAKAGRIRSEFTRRTGWRVITILRGPHTGRSTLMRPDDLPTSD